MLFEFNINNDTYVCMKLHLLILFVSLYKYVCMNLFQYK